MRKLTAALFITVDGVVESPEKWQFDHFDEDMATSMVTHLANQDTALLGRKTYQEWSHYWPTVSDEEPYAGFINRTPKVVVSTTLDTVSWGQWDNVRLITGNVAEQINRLKAQPGKNIGVSGSPTLVRSLLRDGLLDQLTLMVHPVVAGQGRRLFPEGDGLQRLELVDCSTTRTGVVHLTYQPRPA